MMAKVFGKAQIDKQKLEDANYAFEQIDCFAGIKIYRLIKDRFGTHIVGDQCGEGFVEQFSAENDGVVVFNWREGVND